MEASTGKHPFGYRPIVLICFMHIHYVSMVECSSPILAVYKIIKSHFQESVHVHLTTGDVVMDYRIVTILPMGISYPKCTIGSMALCT